VSADTIVAAYLPATSTNQTLGALPTSFAPNNRIGQSFVLTSAATITGVDFDTNGTIGETQFANLFIFDGVKMIPVATSTNYNFSTSHNVNHFDFPTPYAAAAGTYVVTVRSNYNAATMNLYGTRSNAYVNGCQTTFTVYDSSAPCDTTYGAGGSDAYFAVYASENTTGIDTVRLPANNISYATPFIIFDFDFYSSTPAVTSAGVHVVDLTTLQTVDTSAYTISNSSSGSKNYYKSITLEENHRYQWRPYIYTTSGYIYGTYRYFNTGVTADTEVASSTILDLFDTFVNGAGTGSILDNAFSDGDFNDATNAATSTASGIVSFSNIPSYFAQRIPIGYVYDIYDIWNAVSTSSSEFGNLSINFANLDISTSSKVWLPAEITFFGTSTVTGLLDDSTLDLLNALASATIAVTWGMYIFRRATKVISPV